MSEQNKQLARRWFEEVWNQQNEAAIDDMFHEDGKAYGLPGVQGAIEGPHGFKELHRNFLKVFPDVRVHIEDIVAEGDLVALRWTATMTHRGDDLGFPATGKAGHLEGSSFLVVKGGKILNGWNQMDFQGLIGRLQEQPAEAQPDATTV